MLPRSTLAPTPTRFFEALDAGSSEAGGSRSRCLTAPARSLRLLAFGLVLASASAATGGGIENVRTSAFDVARDEHLVAFHTSEEQQGEDLNGDGDLDDFLVLVHDVRTGETEPVGAGEGSSVDKILTLRGPLVAFNTGERFAAADLNGDGDTADPVLHVYNAEIGTTTNLGFASPRHADAKIRGHRIAFAVDESRDGSRDLNGDGDAFDQVVHLHDLPSGTTTNLGVHSQPFAYHWITEDHLALGVSELWQGRGDLNGDGDANDWVLHVYDLPSASMTNLGLSVTEPQAHHERLWFLVSESAQGGVDLNGDGDGLDLVLHLFDPATWTVANLGLTTSEVAALGGGRIAFRVWETGQGETDLNGDGDTSDWVPFFYDLESSTSTNLGVAANGWAFGAGIGALIVPEWDEGLTDLNGDGDTYDYVAHVYDADSAELINTGLSVEDWKEVLLVEGNLLALNVAESRQGGLDLNGDGDAIDRVAHLVDLSASTVTNLGLVTDTCSLRQRVLACAVNEAGHGGTDLNGDGDVTDDVLFFYDEGIDLAINTRLALELFRPINTRLSQDGGVSVFTVSEFLQGNRDLNGDGDARDRVLHTADTSMIFVSGLLERLGEEVESLSLDRALETQLLAQVALALTTWDDAWPENDPAVVRALGTFVEIVERNRGRGLSEDEADALLATALAILDRLPG